MPHLDVTLCLALSASVVFVNPKVFGLGRLCLQGCAHMDLMDVDFLIWQHRGRRPDLFDLALGCCSMFRPSNCLDRPIGLGCLFPLDAFVLLLGSWGCSMFLEQLQNVVAF